MPFLVSPVGNVDMLVSRISGPSMSLAFLLSSSRIRPGSGVQPDLLRAQKERQWPKGSRETTSDYREETKTA